MTQLHRPRRMLFPGCISDLLISVANHPQSSYPQQSGPVHPYTPVEIAQQQPAIHDPITPSHCSLCRPNGSR
ncbi:hypothetical protein FIBSPDRAFT_875407 [Athelia psychrophila]|uniref:Uncharacterized protein n=1 Tax=Athelia psychrophila TaxID=1759441 RepID=A0A167XSG1_9AGAM|nr:hypothetical protein FIBSPDRAFT_875407 [Fibularhizoctonia sp. CBS 109695]